MPDNEKLCLQWNDFKDNVHSAFRNLREDREFSDVTLACEDGQQIEAHKVILASSSPFFMDLLRRNKHPHPLIYMRGVKFEDLKDLVDFLYFGEVNVCQENLDTFLALAEELRSKGLTGTSESKETEKQGFVKPPEKSVRLKEEVHAPRSFRAKSMQDRNSEPPLETTIAVNNSFKVNVEGEELDDQIVTMINTTDRVDPRGRKLVVCNVCGNEGQRAHVVRHIEANHITGVSHSCDICGKTSRSRNALINHKCENHNKITFQE